ncbi:class B sortase [Cohnella lupini]|uniref:SrtB family sortase n=1 Tax=Cohnella lupini TaxID=1294267 RepID=A0A3D9IXD7_9BACL|nr:class B sortase [Cohnella lupini]RED66375.1 SrtB family sortase [Cohnella lupini]
MWRGRGWAYYGITAACAAIFLFSAFKIAFYYADARASSKQMNEARTYYHEKTMVQQKRKEAVIPVATPESIAIAVASEIPVPVKLRIQDRFKPLLEMNEDVIGWIHIDDTVIDYPVLQGDDNEYYLNKDLDRKDNVNGSIFMDYRNRIDAQEKHLILYGHNMKNKSMFMALLNYESRWFFQNHSIIAFDTLYDSRKLQVFSAYFTDASDDYIRTDFKTDSDYKDFLVSLREKSLHKTDISVDENDTILTLSTCSNTNDEARFVVHAKLMDSL